MQVTDSATSMKRLDSMTRTRSANTLNVAKASVTRSGSDEALGSSSSSHGAAAHQQAQHAQQAQHVQQARHAQQAQQDALAYTHGGQANPPPLVTLTTQGSRGLPEGFSQKGPRVAVVDPRTAHARKSSLEDAAFDSDADSNHSGRQVGAQLSHFAFLAASI